MARLHGDPREWMCWGLSPPHPSPGLWTTHFHRTELFFPAPQHCAPCSDGLFRSKFRSEGDNCALKLLILSSGWVGMGLFEEPLKLGSHWALALPSQPPLSFPWGLHPASPLLIPAVLRWGWTLGIAQPWSSNCSASLLFHPLLGLACQAGKGLRSAGCCTGRQPLQSSQQLEAELAME